MGQEFFDALEKDEDLCVFLGDLEILLTACLHFLGVDVSNLGDVSVEDPTYRLGTRGVVL